MPPKIIFYPSYLSHHIDFIGYTYLHVPKVASAASNCMGGVRQ